VILAVIITAIVVGAAVGGGIGSQLNKDSNHGPSHITTVTTTATATATATASTALTSDGRLVNYDAEPVSKVLNVALDCPARNNENYKTILSPEPKSAIIRCGTNLEQTPTFTLEMLAYHLDDCIEACGNYKDANNVSCTAATFHTWMYNSGPTFNCWLFTGTVGDSVTSSELSNLSDNTTASAYF
jgi:hypothetical protein